VEEDLDGNKSHFRKKNQSDQIVLD
jgi:hypothetical protein